MATWVLEDICGPQQSAGDAHILNSLGKEKRSSLGEVVVRCYDVALLEELPASIQVLITTPA